MRISVRVGMLAAIVAAGAARAEVVAIPALKCKFEVPAGWEKLPQEAIDKINAAGGTKQMVAGYGKVGDAKTYIVLQVNRRPAGEPKEHLDDIRRSMPGAKVEWDDVRKCVIITMQVRDMIDRAYAFFREKEVLTFHCYSAAEKAEEAKKTYDAFADSVKFD